MVAQCCSSLIGFWVAERQLGDASATAIADALKLNPSVTSVDLSSESALCQRAHVGFVPVTCVVGFHSLA